MQKWISKIKNALFKTSRVLLPQDSTMMNGYIDINEEIYENLFEQFIKADIGINLSEEIINNLKKQIKEKKIKKQDLSTAIKVVIKQVLGNKISTTESALSNNKKKIYLIVGVNGSGKTTSIGKLAKKYKDHGNKVLIVAGDTFRAAASEQLEIWAKRVDVDVFSPSEIKKPDAVIYAALEKAKKENFDVVLIDTAGRLHSQINLMEELKKINSVIEKKIVDEQIEKLIVLDATIGQNAITQAELFSKAINLTGIILAKLDSSAKGGVILNIMHKLSLPVKLIGTGENIDDIAEFNFDEYLDGLLV